MSETEQWDIEICPKSKLLSLNLREVWKYRDLLFMFVKRDFVTQYKQTILGPIWFFIQPIFTTLTFTVIFGRMAGISTDGLPKVLFYLSGIVCWTYFSDSLLKTSKVFKENEGIFGKVYFPRLITPLSIVVSGLLKLGVQLLLLVGFLLYYVFVEGFDINLKLTLLLFPFLILLLACLSLGFGMLITSMTTKYRDLNQLLAFAVQLVMYATPIIYPISTTKGLFRDALLLNPLTAIIETFRFSVLGVGHFDIAHLSYSIVFSIVLLLLGAVVFNRTEKTFMDTV